MTEENNPYAPPSSRVSDTGRVHIEGAPRQVIIATRLLWASLLLVIPYVWILLKKDTGDDSAMITTIAVVGIGVVCAIEICLIIYIGRGYKWARIVFLIFVLVGLLGLVPFEDAPETTPAEWGLTGVSIALEIAAMYLLFTKPASAWFKRH